MCCYLATCLDVTRGVCTCMCMRACVHVCMCVCGEWKESRKKVEEEKGEEGDGDGHVQYVPRDLPTPCNLNGLVVQLALGLLEHGACLLEGVLG